VVKEKKEGISLRIAQLGERKEGISCFL